MGGLILRSAYLLRKLLAQHHLSKNAPSLSSEEHEILSWVHWRGPSYPSDLAKLTLKEKTGVSKILASLEKKMLIQRSVDPSDRRRFSIDLTDQGRRVTSEFLPWLREVTDTMTSGLEHQHVKQAHETIEHMHHELRKIISDAPPRDTEVCHDV